MAPCVGGLSVVDTSSRASWSRAISASEGRKPFKLLLVRTISTMRVMPSNGAHTILCWKLSQPLFDESHGSFLLEAHELHAVPSVES